MSRSRRSKKKLKVLPGSSYLKKPCVCICTLVLIIITILLYDTIYSEDLFNISNCIEDIDKNFMGQKDAVLTIVNKMQNFNSDQKLNIVSFLGTHGVGKTFLTEIIKNYFSGLVFEMSLLSNNKNNQIELFINSNVLPNVDRPSLIIIDDLSVNNLNLVIDAINRIPKTAPILILVIFNIIEVDSNLVYTINYNNIDIIKEGFSTANINCTNVVFNEFSFNEAKTWLTKVMHTKKLQLTDTLIKNVINNSDLKLFGLKGLDKNLLKNL